MVFKTSRPQFTLYSVLRVARKNIMFCCFLHNGILRVSLEVFRWQPLWRTTIRNSKWKCTLFIPFFFNISQPHKLLLSAHLRLGHYINAGLITAVLTYLMLSWRSFELKISYVWGHVTMRSFVRACRESFWASRLQKSRDKIYRFRRNQKSLSCVMPQLFWLLVFFFFNLPSGERQCGGLQ